ncbi:MAG TPA: GNAT family N-acetyltransferase, partial [Candidatus Sulfotelmatobacter sp.]|nr:GNAT family N-acetyltransferase [Candidatus Sulfotelmatobacter sp.]
LAEYERDPNAVIATEEGLIRDGFGPQPKYRCLIAEWQGRPSGFAFFHYNYSTWRGQPGLYLEDLFVLPEDRGKGIGKALLQRLAQIALEEKCYGLRWMVLEWNTPAIKFYESLGAELLGEWETMLLRGEALARLAGGEKKAALSSVQTRSGGTQE